MNEHGMVVKIKRNTCIVLTPDGEYREVPLPGGAVPRLGQEIQLKGRKRLPYLKQLMAAASLFIILMAGLLYFGETPPAAAYLTIDINPSIELAVSTEGKVISARAMDAEGEKILAEVKVKGRDLREAVGLLVTQSIADNYIEESGDNVILATLTVASGAEPLVDLNSVYEAIQRPVESSCLKSDVIIEPVEPELRQEAAASGISTGRYLLLNKSDEKGLQLSISDITSMSLGKLKKEKKMNLVDLVAGEENDQDAVNKSQGQDDKTAKRGIYVKQKKPVEAESKPVGKVTISEEKQTDRESDEKKAKDKSKDKSKDKDKDRDKGNGEDKQEFPGNRLGKYKDKTDANSDKGDNSKRDRVLKKLLLDVPYR
ncbi:MAG: anti-sigma factor domain-containing protein [Desulfotomaculaceae bacterium]|nr:anti-sigma factor domain-containing protein [Desulfotomaculaceae bacterium]